MDVELRRKMLHLHFLWNKTQRYSRTELKLTVYDVHTSQATSSYFASRLLHGTDEYRLKLRLAQVFGVHPLARIASLYNTLQWFSERNCHVIDFIHVGNCRQDCLHGLRSWPVQLLSPTIKKFNQFFLFFNY